MSGFSPSYLSSQKLTEYRLIELCRCLDYCSKKKYSDPQTWHLKYETVTDGLPLAEDTALSATASDIMSLSGDKRELIESYTRPGKPWFGWWAVLETTLFNSVEFSESHTCGETVWVERRSDIITRKLLLVGPDVQNPQPPFLTCNIIVCREMGKDDKLFPGRRIIPTSTTGMHVSSEERKDH